MLEAINEEELKLMECLSHSESAIECIFEDLENCTYGWDEEKLGHIRFGQLPLLSSEYILDDIPDLDPKPELNAKANFRLREGAGSIDCSGARKFGKTHFVELLDILVACIWLDDVDAGFSSCDAIHIKAILENKLIPILTKHPLYDSLLLDNAHKGIKRSPTYTIRFKNGFLLISINMNIMSKAPGEQFHGLHLKRLYIEESSKETNEVNDKRMESVSEMGCVIRAAGMTDFTRYMPAGKRFYDLSNKSWVCNLPMYISPMFDEKEKAKAILKYHGEQSIGYRVYVKGEVVEEGISVLDMKRVRSNYIEDKFIKTFEVSDRTFSNFQEIIVIDKPEHIDECYIGADIGEAAPSKLLIFFRKDKTYHYEYKITLYNLDDKQQSQIFKYVAEKLGVNVISIDTTEGTARAVARTLEDIFGQNHVCRVSFSSKIKVDFEKDDKGDIKFDDKGQPIYVEEFITEWSIKRIKDLFYENILKMPCDDYELDEQMNGLVSVMSGNRVIYSSRSEDDHTLAALRVFAIAQWENEFSNIKAIKKKKRHKGGV